jgi:serine/threonine protein kinase/WD40 repeat protein
VGIGKRVEALVDELLVETVPDGKPSSYTEMIQKRIEALNLYFDGVPESAPKYRVLELVGRGGMGAVFKAEQRSPVRRLVALKLVKPGYDSKEVIARFESERQALARMDHGCVAKVLDAGADDMDRPYFVMEYVPGKSITEFADENKLPIRKRLELFIDVCSAIAHAHSKGIIHRDIKGGNVLAYHCDGKPVVKVIDFGIAKALTGERLTDMTMNTRHGQLLGTYESMSPEQAEGTPDIDTRTDIYSLGALLYELLTGAAPFDREMFSKAADQEIRRIIREVEPPRPSTRVTSLGGDEGTKVATSRQEPLAELAAELRTELEWIPLMAMRKSRDRRYATPLELADDIRRYLEHRPLRAGPESTWYVASKALRRHRVLVGAGVAVFLSLAVGLIVSTVLMGRARRAEANIAQEVEEIENSMAFGGDFEADRNDVISARRLYSRALDELRVHDEASSAVLAGLNELESSDRGEIPLLGSFGEDGGVAAFRGHVSHPNSVVVLNDRRRALTAGSDGQLYLWNLLNGREILRRSTESNKTLAYVAVAADGKLVATAGFDGRVRLWDVESLKEQDLVLKVDDKSQVWIVQIAPDGEKIVAGTNSGELWQWERKDAWKGRQVWNTTESVEAIAFPPGDSRFALLGDGNRELRLWDLETNRELWKIVLEKGLARSKGINCIAFSNDGTKVAIANLDGTAVLWDVQGRGADMTLVRKRVILEAPVKVWRVAFSPDGTKVAAGADDGGIRVYDTTAAKLTRQLMAQANGVNGVAFIDDNTLVSTGDDTMGPEGKTLQSALRVWDLSDRGIVLTGAAKSLAKRVSVDDSGRTKVETASGESIEAHFGVDGRLRSGSGESNAIPDDMSATYVAALKRATWEKGRRRNSAAGQGRGWQELSESGDGKLKFLANDRNELEMRGRAENTDARSGLVHLRTLRGHHARVVAAGISPNRRFIVSIDEHGRCLGWDLLRPAVCRNFEIGLDVSRGSEEIAKLKEWFTFRGRGDLAAFLD